MREQVPTCSDRVTVDAKCRHDGCDERADAVGRAAKLLGVDTASCAVVPNSVASQS